MDRDLILKQIWPSIGFLLISALLFGGIYPTLTTVILQFCCAGHSNGSLLYVDDKIVGSQLIGQSFNDPKYFWGRASATQPQPYNAAASQGSNLGTANPLLAYRVQAHVEEIQQSSKNKVRIPVDLVTSSGSGLDPHISLQAALYQIPRVAAARGMDEELLKMLINTLHEKRQWLILGEPRVNVLVLNLTLDRLSSVDE
jgi:potassium-transporting ATPase KdpC subunit